MKQQATFLMLAKTFKGLEEVLAQELIELGANDVQLERRAVSFRGDIALLYRANLCLRTASRILVPIVEATLTPKKKNIAPEDLLYEAVKRVSRSVPSRSKMKVGVCFIAFDGVNTDSMAWKDIFQGKITVKFGKKKFFCRI